MVQAVSGNPRAIGYVGLGYMCAKLRGLTVNGLEPRVDTVKSGAYPLSRRLYMVLPGPPTGLAGRFLDFLLGARRPGHRQSGGIGAFVSQGPLGAALVFAFILIRIRSCPPAPNPFLKCSCPCQL